MKDEVASAVEFLTNILKSRGNRNESQIRQFSQNLSTLLYNRFHEHWFPEKPFKGSGFRCIRLNHNMDPIILQAGQMCGLNQSFLETTFPQELTLWVDPREVSFRIGENGSVGILYESKEESHQMKNVNSFKSCKDQFMNGLPSMARDSMLAGFISS